MANIFSVDKERLLANEREERQKLADTLASLYGEMEILSLVDSAEAFEMRRSFFEDSLYRIYGFLWSILPEFRAGFMSSFYFDGFYYSSRIRYEKSLFKPTNTLDHPAGYITGWSVSVSAKMNGLDMVGLKMDVRWALH